MRRSRGRLLPLARHQGRPLRPPSTITPGERGRPRLDRTPRGIRAVHARIGAPVYDLSPEELATLGFDAGTLAFLRRRRGWLFDSRIEQLTQAKLLREREHDHERCDALLDVIAPYELGRAILAVCFGPANRAVLALYWDVIHELSVEQLWLGELTGIIADDELTPSFGILAIEMLPPSAPPCK
jgi:hypothetical protein